MPEKRPRSYSLTFKVDFLLIAALAIGIGAVMAAFTVSLVAFRDQLSKQSLKTQGDNHFVAVPATTTPMKSILTATETPMKSSETTCISSPERRLRAKDRNTAERQEHPGLPQHPEGEQALRTAFQPSARARGIPSFPFEAA
jgi:hypothetical protein